MEPTLNVDHKEINKFSELAARWWDPESELKTLHQINPLRLAYVERWAQLKGKKVLDVGCGGGLLSEAMAAQGAEVMGIDLSGAALQVARLHLRESGLEVQYERMAVEQLAASTPESFDVLTCMELLEHVPDPTSVIHSCARLLRPGGRVIFSTLNRNPKSYLFAIVGAEYLLGMLPKGTHDYAKFIRPSELDAWIRTGGLDLLDITGVTYNPFTRDYALSRDVDVNYMVCCEKPE